MKSILISIKPKYVADILNHKKTIEVRKVAPKCDLPIDVYIYCTKDKDAMLTLNNEDTKSFGICLTLGKKLKDDLVYFHDKKHQMNGKVVAKFTLNKVEEILHFHKYSGNELKTFYFTNKVQAPSEFERTTCLTKEEIYNYCLYVGYAWHISNLVIFDKPKRLDNFERYGSWRLYQKTCPKALQGRCNHGKSRYINHCIRAELTKAPQSYMFIEAD